MRKHLTFLVALLAAGAVHAQSDNPGNGLAQAGIAADLGTTAIGLSMGAAEANPLGLALVPLKFLMKAQIDKIPDENQRREATAQFTGMQFGAAAANICTLAIGNPAIAAVCFAGGMLWGYDSVKSIPTQADCVDKHRAKFEEAVATGRVYRVSIKNCEGHFETPLLTAEADPQAQPGPDTARQVAAR